MEKLKADEIRRILKNDYGYNDNQISEIKGIKELREELRMARESDTDFEDMEIQENNPSGQEEGNSPLTYLHPEWTEHMLSQLRDDEKDKEYPKAAGLRRLVEKYIGHIVQSKTTHVTNFGEAIVVQQEIKVETPVGTEIWSRNGEANAANCQSPYNKYMVAVAESRAEARCLRAILRLNTPTFEEMQAEIENKDEMDLSIQAITDSQKNIINVLTKELNINTPNLIKNMFKDEEGGVPLKLSREQGASIIEQLNTYRKDKDSIDDELKGFIKWNG